MTCMSIEHLVTGRRAIKFWHRNLINALKRGRAEDILVICGRRLSPRELSKFSLKMQGVKAIFGRHHISLICGAGYPEISLGASWAVERGCLPLTSSQSILKPFGSIEGMIETGSPCRSQAKA